MPAGGKKEARAILACIDHICLDAEHGLMRRYAATDASVHDSQVLGQLLDEDNQSNTIWADSAYCAEVIKEALELIGFDSQIHERGDRNHPLSEEQQQSNRTKSKTRAKVEHVFGAWVMQMGGKLVRSIGIVRAKTQLGLKNLTYNLMRYAFLETKGMG